MSECLGDISGCSDPKLCPLGSLFTTKTLQGTCIACDAPIGFHCCDGVATVCPAGFYCPNTPSAVPVECPEGYICQGGFAEPMKCNSLSSCPAGSSTGSPGTGAILLLVSLVVVLALCVWIARKIRIIRLNRATAGAQKHYEVKLLFSQLVFAVTGLSVATEPFQGLNEKIRYTSPVSIFFDNLGMKLKSNGTVVLDGVSGEFPPGSLVAVMGGSGAGKTTFMNALADRAPYGTVTGDVRINGIPGETLSKYPRLVGFVPQDDIMHDDLTVFENLMYSARLRLPPSIPPAQQRAIVEDVLEILDLGRIRDSVVGNPEKRGISGGQKKRVNIGIDLVAYPRILFLDEPTSGLDSAASRQVARCLQRMGGLGITVITVIHQPRWSVFKCFSHCLLLAKGGRAVYLGPTGSIQAYFEACGFELPPGENVADWFVDIVSGQVVRKSLDSDFVAERDLPIIWKIRGLGILAYDCHSLHEAGGSRKSLDVSSDTVEELEQILDLNPNDEITRKDIARLLKLKEIEVNAAYLIDGLYSQILHSLRPGQKLTVQTLVSVLKRSCREDTARSRVDGSTMGLEKLVNRPGAPFWTQLFYLIKRNVAKFNFVELFVKSLIAAFVSTSVSLLFKPMIDYYLTAIVVQPPLTLFSIISGASFIYVFANERITLTRESQTGFSVTAYWMAKNIVNLIDIAVISIVFYTFYFMITEPTYSFMEGLSVYLLMAGYTSGFSHFTAVTLPLAIALLVSVLIPAIQTTLFAGVRPAMISATSLQKFISYIGFGYYSVADLALFRIKSLPKNVQTLPEITFMMNEYSYDLSDIPRNSWIVFGLGLACRLMTFAALWFKVYGFPVKIFRKLSRVDFEEPSMFETEK